MQVMTMWRFIDCASFSHSSHSRMYLMIVAIDRGRAFFSGLPHRYTNTKRRIRTTTTTPNTSLIHSITFICSKLQHTILFLSQTFENVTISSSVSVCEQIQLQNIICFMLNKRISACKYFVILFIFCRACKEWLIYDRKLGELLPIIGWVQCGEYGQAWGRELEKKISNQNWAIYEEIIVKHEPMLFSTPIA